jgi:cell division protease FtsH
MKKSFQKAPKGESPFKGNSFSNNVVSAFLIFLMIVFVYSLFADNKAKIEQVPISAVASDVSKGLVKEIAVKGADLEIKYNDGSVKQSKKETEIALSETLSGYGVSKEKISAVSLDVKDPRGAGYWFLSAAPFLVPILFIAFFVWFLGRQVKGAGMQAFSFGQSKARIIFPNDKKQLVTFKDVAGMV